MGLDTASSGSLVTTALGCRARLVPTPTLPGCSESLGPVSASGRSRGAFVCWGPGLGALGRGGRRVGSRGLSAPVARGGLGSGAPAARSWLGPCAALGVRSQGQGGGGGHHRGACGGGAESPSVLCIGGFGGRRKGVTPSEACAPYLRRKRLTNAGQQHTAPTCVVVEANRAAGVHQPPPPPLTSMTEGTPQKPRADRARHAPNAAQGPNQNRAAHAPAPSAAIPHRRHETVTTD